MILCGGLLFPVTGQYSERLTDSRVKKRDFPPGLHQHSSLVSRRTALRKVRLAVQDLKESVSGHQAYHVLSCLAWQRCRYELSSGLSVGTPDSTGL